MPGLLGRSLPRRDALASLITTFGAASARGFGFGGKGRPVSFATLNPADKSANITLSNGNLTASSSAANHSLIRSTISKTSGKWYWEFHCDVVTTHTNIHFGTANATAGTSGYVGQGPGGWDEACGDSDQPDPAGFSHNASSAGSSGTAVAFTTGDYLNVALDVDGGQLWLGKNGTWMSGNPSTNTSPVWSSVSATPLFAALSFYVFSGSATLTANFGASAFNNTVPTGFAPGLYTAPGCDPNFTSTQLLLHLDGTNGGSSFPDSSGAARTATLVGTPTTETGTFQFGSAAGDFTVNANGLTFPDAAALRVGTGDFSIEFWENPQNLATATNVISKGAGNVGGWRVSRNSSGQLRFVNNADATVVVTESAAPTSAWHFYEITQASGNMTMYRDGTSVATGTTSQNMNDTGVLRVGYDGTTFGARSYIDDLRFTVGVARSNAVPQTPFPNC